MSFINILPLITFMLTGFAVGTLQIRKAAHSSGLKRRLAIGVAAFTYIPAFGILVLTVKQGFQAPGIGFVVALSILFSLAFWTASLIWAGPAEVEDKWAIKITLTLLALMGIIIAFARLTVIA